VWAVASKKREKKELGGLKTPSLACREGTKRERR